jgi:hypothetical protein
MSMREEATRKHSTTLTSWGTTRLAWSLAFKPTRGAIFQVEGGPTLLVELMQHQPRLFSIIFVLLTQWGNRFKGQHYSFSIYYHTNLHNVTAYQISIDIVTDAA